MATVFDIETDGLLDELTKIHVLSYSDDGNAGMMRFNTETFTLTEVI